MIPGITLKLGGNDFVVPPLTLGALEDLQERIKTYDGSISAPSIGTVIDCALAALRRNYPEITRDQVRDMIDVSSMGNVMQAVMDVAGLHRRAIESGEAGQPVNQ